MANAAKRPGVWGIDLGQCALKAIRLEEQDGEILATAFDYIEHPKILSQPDADPDQLTREALEKFLSRNELKGDTVAISVPGQSGLARFVKLPPVDEKKIPDIVRFEAKQQIPFPLHEVVWGYQRLGKGMMADNMVLEAEIGLFAMKRDMVNRYLQHFKDVNVEIHYIQMAPLALCNFMAHDLLGKGAATEGGGEEEEESAGEKNCVVGLDIGADNSNLVITDGEKIIWQRPIPLGGNHFTRALTKDLKLTFAKAEHLKRNAMKSPDLKKILTALKPVLNDFVSEVQRSLGYFTNTHRDANVLHMLGLGNAFRLPGLQKYLQEKLQLEVKKLSKIKRLTGDESVTAAPQFADNVLSFAVAHGLALQGLNQTCIHTNLLPPEISKERAIRAKKPWVAAAAAVLLLLTPPLLLGWSAGVRAYKNPEVNKAIADLSAAKQAADSDVKAYKKAAEDAEASRRVVLNLTGGVNERLNWIHLNNVINEAVPRPDPDNSHVLDAARRTASRPFKKYFDDKAEKDKFSGREAWEQLQAKAKPAQGGAAGKDQKSDDDGKQYLVQLHIEGVTALYVDNLATHFFVRLDPKKALAGLSPEQIKGINARQDPSWPKAGWLVEIRGYTYHKETTDFIRDTLVENLIDLAEATGASRKLKGVALHPGANNAVLREIDKDKKEDKPRMTHILLYDSQVDYDPRPGTFTLIGKSSVAELLPKGVTPPPAAAPTPGSDGKEEPKQAPVVVSNRTDWRPPSGTLFADTFGGNVVRAAVRQDDAKAPAGDTPAARRIPRTEFVVMFVWQEATIGPP